ncbi:hypothetical protein M5689_024075 [Euphorbia peplus]|nr:hypothetical protein M5689_024075 [Euphorbia peplus]
MTSQRKVVLLFITILLSLFFQFPCEAARNSPAIPPLVKELCAKTTTFKPFCIKTLSSDKLCWQAKNFVDLTKIFLSLGEKNAQYTQKYIGGLATNKDVTPESKKALNKCIDQYGHISVNFVSALGEVKDGDYLFANYDMMVSFDSINMCNATLSNAKLSIKGISDKINITNYFINIGVTFTNTLIG